MYTNFEKLNKKSGFSQILLAVITGVLVLAALGIYTQRSRQTLLRPLPKAQSQKQTTTPNSLNVSVITRSVVNLYCSNSDGTVDGGSGTIMSEDGLIMTNYHVISKAKGCLVAFPNPNNGAPVEIYLAKPIYILPAVNKEYDIATIKIQDVYTDERGNTYGSYPKKFQVFTSTRDPHCSNSTPELGDSIRIFGYPVTSGGYNLTITDGIVSSFTGDNLILTSAKVDSGNSGGLAVDQYGCYIGIPSAVETGNYQNLGVIIPKNVVSNFLDKISK